jgi:hypothetical protein
MKDKHLLIGVNLFILTCFIYFLSWNQKPKVEKVEKKAESVAVKKVEEKKELPVEAPVEEVKESKDLLDQTEIKAYIKGLQVPLESALEQEHFFQSDKFKLFLLAQQQKLQDQVQKNQMSNLENQLETIKKKNIQEQQEKIMEEALSRVFTTEVSIIPPAKPLVKVENKVEPKVVEKKEEIKEKEEPISKESALTSLVSMIQQAFERPPEKLPEPTKSENYELAHKMLLDKALEEKIPSTVLFIHDKLSQELKSLKSKQIKEIEVIRKEDSYNKISDFLLNTGDRYIILSVSIPKESSPYSKTGSSYEVEVKVLDSNEEVLSFHVSLEEKTKEWGAVDVQSYVPGEWVKILKSLK